MLVERLYEDIESPINRPNQPGYETQRENDEEGNQPANGQFDEFWSTLLCTEGCAQSPRAVHIARTLCVKRALARAHTCIM